MDNGETLEGMINRFTTLLTEFNKIADQLMKLLETDWELMEPQEDKVLISGLHQTEIKELLGKLQQTFKQLQDQGNELGQLPIQNHVKFDDIWRDALPSCGNELSRITNLVLDYLPKANEIVPPDKESELTVEEYLEEDEEKKEAYRTGGGSLMRKRQNKGNEG